MPRNRNSRAGAWIALVIFLACIGVGVGLYFMLAPKPKSESDAAPVASPGAGVQASYPTYVLTAPPLAISFAKGMTLVPATSPPLATIWWVYKGAAEHGSVGLVPDAGRWLLVAFGGPATSTPGACTVWAVSAGPGGTLGGTLGGTPGGPSGATPSSEWTFATGSLRRSI